MKKPTLQAIFFDFDGVLVDSNRIKTEAFRTLFAGYDARIVEEIVSYHRHHGGVSRVVKIKYAHQNIIKKALSDSAIDEWAARYSNLVVEKVVDAELINGAKEFLDRMHGTLPAFIISGTPDAELREIVERKKLSGYFQQILGSPVRKPDHICNILTTYQLVPERCVFVGDALTDYHAARKTGLHFIGIQGEVKFPGETIVLPDCAKLQKTLGELFVNEIVF